MESWKSSLGSEAVRDAVRVMFEEAGVGVTTNSRHWGVFECGVVLANGREPVGVVRTWVASFGLGATD